MTRLYLWCSIIVLAVTYCGPMVFGEDKTANATIQSPLSPEESLRYLKVAPGLRVEFGSCGTTGDRSGSNRV